MRLDHITSSQLALVFNTATAQRCVDQLGLDTHRANTDIKTLATSNQSRNTEREKRARAAALERPGTAAPSNRLPGDNSVVAPPDPIPNSEVKRNRADGSVAQAMQE